MHHISTTPHGELFSVSCSCGWSQFGYKDENVAWGVGFAHKQVKEGSPNDQPGGSDDPKIGY